MLAKGTKIYIGDGETEEDFDQIMGVTEQTHSGTAWETEDLTTHDTTDPVSEMETTIRAEGTVTIVGKWTEGNAQLAILRARSLDGQSWNFQTEQVGGAEHVQFAGFVLNFNWLSQVKGHLRYQAVILINGALTPVV